MILPVAPAFEFRVEPHQGLTLVSGGVPLVRGSYLQVASPDWKRAYFGSLTGATRVERIDGDTLRLTFSGTDVSGSQTFHREGDRLAVRTEIVYRGAAPAIAEIAAGLVWVPAFARAATPPPSPTEPIGGRRLAPDGPAFGIDGPVGRLEARASAPVTLFDARRYPQGWAEGRDLLWAGDLDLPLEPGKKATFDFEWRVPTLVPPKATVDARALKATPRPDALVPDESRPLLVPRPETDHLDEAHPIDITAGWNLPVGEFDHYSDLKAALARRFVLPPPGPAKARVNLDGGMSDLGLNPGGYRITLRADRGVTVVGEKDTGLRNAVERLAQIAFVKGGRLMLPSGWLYDQPRVRWRGVHLFGGPAARPFQKALWTRVLRPLGFDHVVLECERTAWDATPGVATSDTMTKAQLSDLFGLYRNLGVEATPLVQSFGHMGWLFAHGKNLDLALNPDAPYAVDPRKPRTAELLGRVWHEAVDLSRPKAAHFGLDEVDGVGWPGDAALMTETWRLQLASLSAIAQREGVAPMLWGDMALAPKEALDATNAPTVADAAARRAAIPKHAYLADWHYKDDPRPEAFVPSLQLWKDAGMVPIAAGWYRPDNVRSLALAAGDLGVGYLQTTWAGYASSEAAMLENPRQFSALVLAADYAWSGRRERTTELPYDPQEVFTRLYFGRPSPLRSQRGATLGEGAAFDVGNVRFRALDLRLASALRPQGGGSSALEVATDASGHELDLAFASEIAAEEGDAVAELRVERAGAPPLVTRLVYGRDLRALSDPASPARAERTVPGGPSCVRLDLGKPATKVTRIVVRPLDAFSGVRLMGATVVE